MHTTTIGSSSRAAAVALLSLMVLGSGCNQAGPGRYEISGEVTHKGQPVPGGRILFTPDDSQANTGPGSVAEIQDGRYRTRRGLGAVDGPHVVTIYGTDGTPATEDRDNALFPEYRTTVNLPSGNAEFNFDIP